jgi:PhnB protein
MNGIEPASSPRSITMSSPVQPIPAGKANLIPHLVCSPCADAIEFYKKAFGAVEVSRMPSPADGRLMHAEIRIGETVVFLADDFPEYCEGKSSTPHSLKGTPVTFHRYVADCDAAVQRALDAGATAKMPPMDMFWGDRYGVITDPFGHQWAFATHIREVSTADATKAFQEMCGG